MVVQNNRLICEDCLLIWRFLFARAPGAETITYGRLADETGIPLPYIRHPERLRRVYELCIENVLGPLDALVVKQRGRRPGKGYFRIRQIGDDSAAREAAWQADNLLILGTDYGGFENPGADAFCA